MALVRGEVESALTGGVPDGKLLIELGGEPAEVTFYVALPPPGTHPNDRRYPIAVVGGGYRGLLESTSTRIPGLVSVADVAPSAVALADGDEPRITSSAADDPVGELDDLDRRLDDARDARFGADLVLIATLLLASAGALRFWSPLLGRAAVLAAPAQLTLALVLSALEVSRPAAVHSCARGSGCPSSRSARGRSPHARSLARTARRLPRRLRARALALARRQLARGDRPASLRRRPLLRADQPDRDAAPGAGAGRPRASPVSPGSPRSQPLGVTVVGLSATGADGGGVLVVLAGFGVLALRLARMRLTLGRLAALGTAVVVAGLLVVGLDAAAGGESHVTRSLGSGPGSFAEDLAHRAEVSFRGPTSSPLPFLITLGACSCSPGSRLAVRATLSSTRCSPRSPSRWSSTTPRRTSRPSARWSARFALVSPRTASG